MVPDVIMVLENPSIGSPDEVHYCQGLVSELILFSSLKYQFAKEQEVR